MNIELLFQDCNSSPLAGRKVLFTPIKSPQITASWLTTADSYNFTTSLIGTLSASIVANNYSVLISNPLPATTFVLTATETGSYVYSGSVKSGSVQDVYFDLFNLVKDASTVKKVTLTPTWNYPSSWSGSINVLCSTSSVPINDSGYVEFSQLVPGVYLVDVIAKVDTTFYISVPSVGTSWNVKDLLVIKPSKGTPVRINSLDNSLVPTIATANSLYVSIGGSIDSASYAKTASYALNGGGGSNGNYASSSTSASWASQSLYAVSSSWASSSFTASMLDTSSIDRRTIGDGDLSGYVFGLEYLSPFLKRITTNVTQSIMMVGDSTTYGMQITTSSYYLMNLLTTMLNGPGVANTLLNDAQSGTTTGYWTASMLPAQVALNPNMMIIRYGINDESDPMFETNLRSGLSYIRNIKSVDSCSIILMTPNATNDDVNHRGLAWDLAMNPIIRKAARDYECTFIDTFTYLRDAYSADVSWLDNWSPGIHLHPLEMMNLRIAAIIANTILPPEIQLILGGPLRQVAFANTADSLTGLIVDTNLHNGSFSNPFGAGQPLTSSNPTSAFFPLGISIHRAVASLQGWPVDGQVVTFRNIDGQWLQFNSARTTDEVYFRTGQSSGWGNFISMTTINSASYAATSSYAGGLSGLIVDTNLHNGSFSDPFGVGQPLTSSIPTSSYFPNGISIHRAVASLQGWPIDGEVITFRNKDQQVFQLNAGRDTDSAYWRVSRTATTWGNFVSMTTVNTASYALTASVALNAVVPTSVASASWVSASAFITTAQTASYITSSNIVGNITAFSASWSSASISASYAPVQPSYSASAAILIYSASLTSVSASWVSASAFITTAQTASYVTASNIVGIVTSASYSSTSSWANNAISASYITSSNIVGNITAFSASWASQSLSASYINPMSQNTLSFANTTLGGGSTVTKSIQMGDVKDVSGKALLLIQGATNSGASGIGGDVSLLGGTGKAFGTSATAGGNVYLIGGPPVMNGNPATGAFGTNINLVAGDATGSNVQGGSLLLSAGSGNPISGAANTSTGGDIILSAGSYARTIFDNTGTMGAIFITTGSVNIGGSTRPTANKLEVQGNISCSVITALFNGTASWAVSASWAPSTGGSSDTASYLTTTNDYTIHTLAITNNLTNGNANVASGLFSHAEGSQSISIGTGSHAEGLNTSASGDLSHAEGYSSQAIGAYSHAEGVSISSGLGSHAEGMYCQANGTCSHAGGLFTRADGDYQTVVGSNNVFGNTTDLFVVGGGTALWAQKDILKVSTTGVIVNGGVTASLFGTASYALTASVALNATIPTSVPSASWVSASAFITLAQTASYISSSVTFNKTVYNLTASWAVSASYVSNVTTATYTSSLYGTASWAVSASNAVSASYSPGGSTATYTSSLYGTASWAQSSSVAISASYAPGGGGAYMASTNPTFTGVLTANTGAMTVDATSGNIITMGSIVATGSITTLGTFVGTASWATNVVNSIPFVTLTSGSSNGITCSLTDYNEYFALTTGLSYSFTSSNPSSAGMVSNTLVYIKNTSVATSSLSFPSGWTFMGSMPTAITSSHSAMLSLQSFGGDITAVWSTQY